METEEVTVGEEVVADVTVPQNVDNAEPNLLEPEPTHDQEQPEPAPENPVPIGPTLDLDSIINESMDILDSTRKKCLDQQLLNQNFIFVFNSVMEIMDAYNKHVDKLNKFLVNNELMQSGWYYEMYIQLPAYGDYKAVFDDTSELRVQVDGIPGTVPEADLSKLVSDVVANYYAGGVHIKAQESVCKNIKEEMKDRRQCIIDLGNQFSVWYYTVSRVDFGFNICKNVIFQVTAHLNFLKIGEVTASLELDVKKALRPLESTPPKRRGP